VPALDINVSDQRVFVTAGAAGAGRAIAQTFDEAGAKVFTCDIDAQAIGALAKERPDIVAFEGDVSDESTVERMFAAIEDRSGPVTVLINNVGIAGPTLAVDDIALADWNRTIHANLTSHFLCVRRAVPSMKRAGGGAIVNISSGSAKVGLPLRLPYVVSKAGVLSLTSNLARELGPFGIRVNAILPGAIRGERINRVIAEKSQALGISAKEYEKDLLRYVSLRTMVDPEDIAAMALFLASPAAHRISGQLIGVDGNFEYEV
jgi:NAD(P)-dependent dehydrogenase (short-subunit alcohol dehydrogenase family)